MPGVAVSADQASSIDSVRTRVERPAALGERVQ